MLAAGTYTQDHVAAARAWARDATAALARVAPEDQPVLGNAMVLALDGWFTHRTRGREGKDGNPMNEVRVLCTSLVEGDGTLDVPKAIRLQPATSVLGLEPGTEVAVDADGFARLSTAFIDAVERTCS